MPRRGVPRRQPRRNPPPRTGLGRNAVPGLGAQLTRRVQAGEIGAEQARRTAQQRQSFAKAYGSDWRSKVFGAPGRVARARLTLAEQPGAAAPKANLETMMAKRAAMLEKAKRMPAQPPSRGAAADSGGSEAPSRRPRITRAAIAAGRPPTRRPPRRGVRRRNIGRRIGAVPLPLGRGY